tara:strand:- start:70802 stop:71254 length:453 start_codon:yes stop_codon:yes gene_type:complete
MPNQDLVRKDYIVNDDDAKKYLGDTISGNNLTTIKSRLEKKGDLNNDELAALDWVTKKYENERRSIDGLKRTQMKAGRENTYKKTHVKDNANANPTKVGGNVKMTSSGDHSKVSDQIANNRVAYYESIDKELDGIKYLMEYMDINKKEKK